MSAERSTAGGGRRGAVFRRHLWFLIGLALLGAIAGVAAARLTTDSYSATAAVLVTPLAGNPYSPEGRGDDLLNMRTEAQLTDADVVRTAAERSHGDLPGLVSVRVPTNTQVVEITYTDTSPQMARTGAQAFAEAYLDHRRQRAQAAVDGRLRTLQDEGRRVEEALKRTIEELAAAPPARQPFLNRRITTYTDQLGVIDEQTSEIMSTPTDPGQVITPAAVPPTIRKLRLALYGASGLVGGLVLGFAAVLLRERLRRRVRDADAVERLGIRVLSVVPPPGRAEKPRSGLVHTESSSVTEAYRRLRAALAAVAPPPPSTILVASASPRGSATVTTSNLATALALSGSPTTVVDAAADGPEPEVLFGLGRTTNGLSDVLLHGAEPTELLIDVDPDLRLLPRGSEAASARDRLSGPGMSTVVKKLHEHAQYVLISAPSVQDAAAQALYVEVDAVLLVVDQGVTTREQLRLAQLETDRAGAQLLGAVLEHPAPKFTSQPPAAAGAASDDSEPDGSDTDQLQMNGETGDATEQAAAEAGDRPGSPDADEPTHASGQPDDLTSPPDTEHGDGESDTEQVVEQGTLAGTAVNAAVQTRS